MGGPPAPDPVRAALLAILKQLNQADTAHEGETTEQALELVELEQRLNDFWAITQGAVTVSLALGLLLRNKLVTAQTDQDYSWQRQRMSHQRYQITTDGKKFLVQALETSERIG